MEVAQGERVELMRRHFAAAIRQRQAAKTYPEARGGFTKAGRLHVARVAALAGEICGKPPAAHRMPGAARA